MPTDDRPEQHVLDAIDELVNEQLAIGPVDDYNADRYVKCPSCHHDWHGIMCTHCGCESCDGEAPPWQRRGCVYDPPPDTFERTDSSLGPNWEVPPSERRWPRPPFPGRSPRRDINFRVNMSDGPPELRDGYTLSDVEEMRELWRPPSYVRPDYAERFAAGTLGRPRVRFWARDLARNQLHMIEATTEVMRIDWDRHGSTMTVRLDPYSEYILLDEDRGTGEHPEPAAELMPDMISMEGATPEGFVPIGFIHPDDLEIERTVEPERITWGGDVMRCAQERYEATIRIAEVLPNVQRWEIGGQDT